MHSKRTCAHCSGCNCAADCSCNALNASATEANQCAVNNRSDPKDHNTDNTATVTIDRNLSHNIDITELLQSWIGMGKSPSNSTHETAHSKVSKAPLSTPRIVHHAQHRLQPPHLMCLLSGAMLPGIVPALNSWNSIASRSRTVSNKGATQAGLSLHESTPQSAIRLELH